VWNFNSIEWQESGLGATAKEKWIKGKARKGRF
jgi:hypothetical protein